MGQRVILLAALLVLAAAPLSAAGRAPRPSQANRPPASRIAFEIWYVDATDRGRIVTVRADGRGGVRQLLPGMHNDGNFCQSADGGRIAYQSDQEAPHESFLYVANADGTHAKKVSEKEVGFLCPFTERWLLLSKQVGRGMTIVRHDLQSGAEKTVATNVDYRYSLTPDGNKLLFVGGLDFTPVRGQLRPKGKETIELLDLATLARRRLAGPLPRTKSYRFACSCLGERSPDGRRIVYVVGPSIFADERRAHEPSPRPRARPYAVYARRISRGAARPVLRLSGGPPLISWSPDGRRLLVCADNRGLRLAGGEACSGGDGRPKGGYLRPKFAGKLLLVDLARGSVRRVASGKKLLFAQWAPSGGSYAYATTAAAYVVRRGGARRLLASAPKPYWPGGGWMGWSSDGRYIGLGGFSGRLAVLNAATGQIRVLFRDRKRKYANLAPRWWR